jgi:hypothetical protein
MSRRHAQLYVEESYGVDIAALLQALDGLGVPVIESVPPVAKPCYIIIDIERRRTRAANWIDAWYEARAELNVRGTLIGLVTGIDPVPGTYQIEAWNAVPGVIEALAQIPRAISLEVLEHQRESSQQRQTNRVIHDLRALLESSNLSAAGVRGTLAATWNQVTPRDLKQLIESLMDEVENANRPALLRDILKRQLTTLEDAQ